MCYFVDMVPRQLVVFVTVAAVIWTRCSRLQAHINLCKSSSTIAADKHNVERHVAMRIMYCGRNILSVSSILHGFAVSLQMRLE
jgi:hypothetical protein